jgi:hypothetical protein
LSFFFETAVAALARDLRTLVALHIRIAKKQLADGNASFATFQILVGGLPMEVNAVTVRVGADPQFLQVIPRKADGSVDPSVENVVVTVDGGVGGNGFVEVVPFGDGSDPLKFGVKAIATDPGDVPHTSGLSVTFDSATEEGETQTVTKSITVTSIAENATTATIETIDAP